MLALTGDLFMTESEKQDEIGARIARLNEIRAELTVVRSKHQEGLGRLNAAGSRITQAADGKHAVLPGPPLGHWPSQDQLGEWNATMSRLKAEAGNIIQELTNLGLDPELFRLNGD